MFDFPNAPTTGQTITMPDGTVRRWDGIKWAAGQTPTAPYVIIGDTPPANPQAGWLWFDSVGAQLYLWYNDGNSSQWVPSVAVPASIGEAPLDGNIYARRNGLWTNVVTNPTFQNNVGRNWLHNYTFQVNQRGTGPWTTTATYTSDRWQINMVNDTLSASIITLSDTDRSQIGDEWAATAYQVVFTGSSVAGSYCSFVQRMETLKRFGNKSFMLSFWARAVSGTPRIGITGVQNFGTGGSPSATVNILAGTVGPLTATWTRYSIPVIHPSIAGKTFGTAGSDFANLILSLSDQGNTYGNNIGVQTGTVQLWGMQWELGTYVTPLERIDYQDDLKHCQRFYQSYPSLGFLTYSQASGQIIMPYIFATTLRAAPTVAFAGISYTNCSAALPQYLSANGFGVQITITATGSAQFSCSATASADL